MLNITDAGIGCFCLHGASRCQLGAASFESCLWTAGNLQTSQLTLTTADVGRKARAARVSAPRPYLASVVAQADAGAESSSLPGSVSGLRCCGKDNVQSLVPPPRFAWAACGVLGAAAAHRFNRRLT